MQWSAKDMYGPQRIFIGGLPEDVTSSEISQCFERIGVPLNNIEIALTGFDDGMCRGFAHASARTGQEAMRAVHDGTAKVRDSNVNVQIATTHWTLRPRDPVPRALPPRSRSYVLPPPTKRDVQYNDAYAHTAPAPQRPTFERPSFDKRPREDPFDAYQELQGPPKRSEPTPPPPPPPPPPAPSAPVAPKISPGLAKLAALKAQLQMMKGGA